MSSTTSGSTFPSNGKVLVINMTVHRNAQLKFGSRVYWKSSWEFTTNTPVPDGVVAVVLPVAMKPDPMDTMKSWARRNKIMVEVEPTSETLIKRLSAWLSVDASVNGNGSDASTQRVTSVSSSSPKKFVEAKTEGEIWIKTNRIKPLSGQPRTYFSSKAMKELMTSIKAIGQQTPIIVRRIEGDPDYDYELVDGERRLRACTLLGVKEMLAVVRVIKDSDDQFKKSFVANFAREGHTPLETARFIKRMLGFPEFAGVGKMVALKIIASWSGKVDVWAFNYLKLLDLPEEIQAMLEPDDSEQTALPQAMGLFLSSIQSREIQLTVCRRAVQEKLSVSKAKHLARQLAAKAGVKVGGERTPKADYRILDSFLRRTIEGSEKLLTIPNRSLDELFLNRDLADRKARINDVNTAIELLTKLRDGMELKPPKKRG